MKAIITVGISCSGKTTWAKQQENMVDINRDWIRFNVVSPGSDWGTYKFRGKTEDEVTKIQGQMIMDAWSKEQDICISDTNLNPGRRENLVKTLRDLGYEVEIKEFPITLEEAWKRDSLRVNGVGHSVIYRQYLQWLEHIGRTKYVPDENLPKAIIFDVDGTIAKMNGRGAFEWDKVSTDLQRAMIIQMAQGYSRMGYLIIVVSGRDGVCRKDTEEWMSYFRMPYDEFFIRTQGDMRKDTVIKEEIFWNDIASRYNIVGVVDDRPCVVRMWYELGIENVICVGNPYLEF